MKLFDNVWETSTTTGTVAYVLAGARTNYRAFGDVLANNEYVAYYARSADGASWERCWGQYSSGGNSLTRNLIESSTGALINWAAGTREIYIAPPAKSLNDQGAIWTGTARPAWLPANRLWLKTGVAPLELSFFDGADDISFGKFDATGNGVLPPAFAGRVQFKDAGDVASGAALSLGDGNLFNVTGTTAITSIGTKGIGTVVALRFAAVLTLTHHATDLVLPTAANIVTAAGDVAWFAEYAAGDWRCLGYQRASGKALAETNRLVQAVHAQSGAVATGTTTIPYDDSVPQNTEGTEFLTATITPTSTANYLEIEALLFAAVSAESNDVILALFQDSAAAALAAAVEVRTNSGGKITGVPLRHRMLAGTVAATTFKLRAGPSSAATLTVNGDGSARKLGGVLISSLTIREIAA